MVRSTHTGAARLRDGNKAVRTGTALDTGIRVGPSSYHIGVRPLAHRKAAGGRRPRVACRARGASRSGRRCCYCRPRGHFDHGAVEHLVDHAHRVVEVIALSKSTMPSPCSSMSAWGCGRSVSSLSSFHERWRQALQDRAVLDADGLGLARRLPARGRGAGGGQRWCCRWRPAPRSCRAILQTRPSAADCRGARRAARGRRLLRPSRRQTRQSRSRQGCAPPKRCPARRAGRTCGTRTRGRPLRSTSRCCRRRGGHRSSRRVCAAEGHREGPTFTFTLFFAVEHATKLGRVLGLLGLALWLVSISLRPAERESRRLHCRQLRCRLRRRRRRRRLRPPLAAAARGLCCGRGAFHGVAAAILSRYAPKARRPRAFASTRHAAGAHRKRGGRARVLRRCCGCVIALPEGVGSARSRRCT